MTVCVDNETMVPNDYKPGENKFTVKRGKGQLGALSEWIPARSLKPDLVLVALIMPQKDGSEVAAEFEVGLGTPWRTDRVSYVAHHS